MKNQSIIFWVLIWGIGWVITFISPFADAYEKDKPNNLEDIYELLSKVPDSASWQDLSSELRDKFEEHAKVILEKDRRSWGLSGLSEKESILTKSPTQAMLENIDRILSIVYASELPNGFKLDRDVTNPAMKVALLRIYLSKTDERAYMLLNNREFRGWNGLPVKALPLLDHKHMEFIAAWMKETESQLLQIPDEVLTMEERKLRDKSYFLIRQKKFFIQPSVASSGSFGFATLYKFSSNERPFSEDRELLNAYNASMFAEFREINKGTIESFILDYDTEFNEAWLLSQGMSATLTKNTLKLANLYRTRVLAHPDAGKRCTIYSSTDKANNWNRFTAEQISNGDGSETMESYATGYQIITKRQLTEVQDLARSLINELFPENSSELTSEQRKFVLQRITEENRPAAILETIHSALDEATGTKSASEKVKIAAEAQITVGGYKDGETLRSSDQDMVYEMWHKAKSFLKREYSGYQIDISELLPDRPEISTMGQMSFATGGNVSIALKDKWNKASLYSTILHEIKHAIDQKSHAAVEGAAWEGAAVSVERQVWPTFIAEVMADDPKKLAMSLLKTAIDNVRFTSTTDATLKIFLRKSCVNDEPDTIEYAKQIVASYGNSDPDFLTLRSKRAHNSTQYLQYDYGYVMYLNLLEFLQKGIKSTHRVDAFLLQACAMPSPRKDQAAIDKLSACIQDRHNILDKQKH